MDKIHLSVVMPTMNEEKAVGKVIGDILKYSDNYNLEIVVVDSSTDKTAEIAVKLGARVIKQKPTGPGTALIQGLKEAKGEIVISTDCDDTYPMEDIPLFVDYWKQGYHIVNGSRMNKMNKTMPLFNKFGNWFFAFIVRSLYNIKTTDVTTGMRLYTKELIDHTKWETNYSFPAEILIKSNMNKFKYTEMDIKYRQRIGDVTLDVWRSGKAYMKCFVKYRFNLDFINPNAL